MPDMDLDVRVGDTERRAVDARLQAAVGDGVLTLLEYDERAAAVWAARTRRDLEAVVRDLPPELGGPVPAVAAPAVPLAPRRSLAVMSGDEVRAPFHPGQPVEAYAVMGGAKIDLRTADLPPEVRIRAVAVMGGVEIYVPRGTTVHLSGGALMGGREVKVDPPRPGGPVVHVDAWALMGGVEVKHGRGRKADVVPAGRPWVPAQVAAPVTPPATRHRPRRLARRVGGALLPVALVVGGLVAAAAATDELAVMGGGTEVVKEAGTVDVGVLMGGVTVVVPDGARVDVDGVVVMGGTDCDVCTRIDQAGPRITVRGWGAMGGIDVVTETEHRAERAEEQAEDRAEDDG